MEALFTLMESHPYITYSIAVVMFTAAVRYSFFSKTDLGPKWITLMVGIVLGAIEFFMGWINLETQNEFFMLVASMGAAVVFYDYIIKTLLDLLKKRNPLKE